jgi:hypothetical protein
MENSSTHIFGRLLELREASIALNSPSAYFRADDDKFTNPMKVGYFTEVDRDLAMLPEDAWKQIKVDLINRIAVRDPTRDWQPLFDTFNEVRAYNYLQGTGCGDIRFIPRAKVKKLKTPDLAAAHDGTPILCEVKTINISERELHRRAAGGAGSSSVVVEEKLLEKLSRDITAAKNQMDAYNADARKIAYVVINFDDRAGDCAEEHLAQIENFYRTLRSGVDLVTDVRTPFLTKVTLYSEAG